MLNVFEDVLRLQSDNGRQAAAHARRARRDAAVHQRRQREGRARPASRRGLLVALRKPGARRRDRPGRADREPDAAEADRSVLGHRSRCPTPTSRRSSARSSCARSRRPSTPLEATLDKVQRRDRPAPRRHAPRGEGRRQVRARRRLPAPADSSAVLGTSAARDRQGRQGRRAAHAAEDRPRGGA